MGTGCVGSRVYTDLGDGDLYAVVPGKDLAAIAEAPGAIVSANTTLRGPPAAAHERILTGRPRAGFPFLRYWESSTITADRPCALILGRKVPEWRFPTVA